ncbi:MAG: ATP-binding protein [Planctomycetota bacterium]
MGLNTYKLSGINATLEDLPSHSMQVDVELPVSWLKDYFDAHVDVPGAIVTDSGRFLTILPRDVLYRRLSLAFGRDVFLRRPIRQFLEVFPQEPLRLKSTCTIHQATEQALGRPSKSAYDPILVEYADGRLGLLEMHALLVAQSQVLALTRLVEEQRQAAEAANRSKSEFLANISHELRTPLHGICSYARFGRDEVDSAQREELLDYFVHVEQCADTLLRLVNDLLDLSKLEAGKMRFDLRHAQLAELAISVVDEVSSICAERNVTIEFVPPDEQAEVLVDPDRIKQVLRNLVSNAVKFSPEGSRVVVRLRSVGRACLLSVCDEGPGIPESELEAIFDKFVQSSKTKSGSGGTGLGLAICREIVQGHQGRIWAENNPDHGATFYCEIPLNHAADGEDCLTAEPAASA